MSDARWIEVDSDTASAAKHFGRAAEIYAAGDLEGDDLASYKNCMALLQAMQSVYTSMKAGLERILALLGEEKPVDSGSYHADLVRRASRPIPNARPAIIPADLARAIDETHRFRHVARKSYDDFSTTRAYPSVAAAGIVRDTLEPAIAAFRAAIDA